MNEGLEGRILSFGVDILFVDTFTTVIRVGVVDAFCAVDLGAGGAGWGLAVAFALAFPVSANKASAKLFTFTFECDMWFAWIHACRHPGRRGGCT